MVVASGFSCTIRHTHACSRTNRSAPQEVGRSADLILLFSDLSFFWVFVLPSRVLHVFTRNESEEPENSWIQDHSPPATMHPPFSVAYLGVFFGCPEPPPPGNNITCNILPLLEVTNGEV